MQRYSGRICQTCCLLPSCVCVCMCTLFRKVSLHSSTDRGLLRFCFYSVVQWFVSSLHAFLQRTVKISLPSAHIQGRHGALPRTHSQRPDRRRLLYKTHREAIKSSTKETNTIFFFSFFSRRAYSVLLPCLQHVTSLHGFPLFRRGTILTHSGAVENLLTATSSSTSFFRLSTDRHFC